MKKDELFREVSKICNYTSEELIQDIYFAFIRVISKELRVNKSIVLPKWGEFYLYFSKPKMTKDINTGLYFKLGPKTMVKFIPNNNLKEYFKQISE